MCFKQHWNKTRTLDFEDGMIIFRIVRTMREEVFNFWDKNLPKRGRTWVHNSGSFISFSPSSLRCIVGLVVKVKCHSDRGMWQRKLLTLSDPGSRGV